MRFNELLASLPPSIVQPGKVYAHMLETVRKDTGADRAVLALHEVVGRARWVGYSHDRAEPWFGAELRQVTARKFLEDVRHASLSYFDTYEDRDPTGESMGRLVIRHAVGVRVLDFSRMLGIDDFAGVLVVDRRGESPKFGDDVVRLMEQFAKDVSLLLKAVTERSARTEGSSQYLTARLRSELVGNGGNVAAAAVAVNIPYHRAREIVHAFRLGNWLARLKGKRSPSPDTLKALILETRDLRVVGERVGRNYAELYELCRHKLRGGLRALVEGCHLTWEQVHGPGFQRGEPPPE